MITGNKIYLRAVEESDLPQLMEWRNLPGFRKNFREYRELNLSMQKNWFEKVVLNDTNTLMFSICNKDTGDLLGCCGLCYINWVQRNADISLYIGFEHAYIDSTGYAEEACRLLLQYAFGELGLHKVWTELYEYDHSKISFFTEKFGFSKDGYLREHHFSEGKWWGSYIVSLLHSV